MTTTDTQGFIECTDGTIKHLLKAGGTDGATAYEVQAVDVSGSTPQSVCDAVKNKTITRIALQVSDGSILAAAYLQKNGSAIHYVYGGERIADSPIAANVDIWDLAVEVDETTKLYIITSD